MFTRRDIWTINPNPGQWNDTVLAYANAVQIMKDRDGKTPPDPTSWEYQAARHATGPPGIVPPRGTAEQCQHSSWFFLPWHRMYLYYFERIVRKAVAEAVGPSDFALPYWNYSNGFPRNTLPHPFREPHKEDGTANPLFVAAPSRYGRVNDGAPLDDLITRTKEAMEASRFADRIPGFGGVEGASRAHFGNTPGLVERTPHNTIHREVGRNGGWMGNPATAAIDPVFWLHHANIDRLWNKWLAGGKANPANNEWLSERFQFHDENGNIQSLTGAEVRDTAAQLDYVYDDDVRPFTMPGPEPPSERRVPLELLGATDGSVMLTGTRTEAFITVPDELRTMADERREAPGEVVIALEDITAEREPDDVYALYLNDWLAADEANRYYIGNLALFGVEQWNDLNVDRVGSRGIRFLYDITAIAADLARRNMWDFREVGLTFEPIGFAADEPRLDVVPISVGRIGMYIG